MNLRLITVVATCSSTFLVPLYAVGANQILPLKNNEIQYIPHHKLPEPLSLLGSTPNSKRDDFITFGVMGDGNYKGTTLNDDFSPGNNSQFSIGALQFDSTARALGWLNFNIKGSYNQHTTSSDTTHHYILDNADMVIGNTAVTPLSLTIGFQYLPFGEFQPYSLSGSLTKELEETKSGIIGIGYTKGAFHSMAFLYGSTGKVNNSKRKHTPVNGNYGGELSYIWSGFHNDLQVNTEYLSNFREISLISDLRPQNLNKVGAISTHLSYHHGRYGVLADYTLATKKFDSAAISLNGKDTKPQALFSEFYVRFNSGSIPSVAGIGYGHSWDTLALQQPSHRLLTNYSLLLTEHISLQAQLMFAHDYKTSDTATMNRQGVIFNNRGTGKTNRIFNLQLSFGLGDEHPAMYDALHSDY